ncbi:MAG: monofunctional biosynthetic peptidoglycan transglycosylase [Rhodothermales bacterium]|nr:monofunctional biosynthetic peptidoglycan transglycosylase [Rhodothermales bacterium]
MLTALRRLGRIIVVLLTSYFALCTLFLILLNWTYPLTSGVHIQRRVESLFSEGEYTKRYLPEAPEDISLHLRRAVVAAEDTRFFEHGGFDWEAIQEAYEEGGRRGGSTISQQLAKNLFLTTHRSYVRKALEVPLTFLTEIFLPKERILDIYLNVVEWGEGVYGAEAASRAYFGKSAAGLTRTEAAALASCLPNPRQRRPHLNGWYTRVILRRMAMLGY